MEALPRKLKALNGGRILDVATGHGQFIKLLTDFFNSFTEAVGVDLEESNIEIARKEAGENFVFKAMDATKLDFADSSFDTVSIRHSLHHLADIKSSLTELNRVLKPGGLFVIGELFQEPESERENSQRHLHHWWAAVHRAEGGSHNETFTKAEIVKIIDQLKLTELDIFEDGEEFDPAHHDEVLEHMIERSKSMIQGLIDAKGDANLISQGEELVARFSKLGFVSEDVLYILGRKAI